MDTSGLNLIMTKEYVLVVPVSKEWTLYGGQALYWEPWSYLGFFSLPVLQNTWPGTRHLQAHDYVQDIHHHLKSITQQ